MSGEACKTVVGAVHLGLDSADQGPGAGLPHLPLSAEGGRHPWGPRVWCGGVVCRVLSAELTAALTEVCSSPPRGDGVAAMVMDTRGRELLRATVSVRRDSPGCQCLSTSPTGIDPGWPGEEGNLLALH